ncbi:hypothetical protein MG293_000795, partial [Ovis ammon polii]
HLVIPGLNETTVKLPTSIMFEISEAIKTQLAKNETLALPAESKTPEVEKIPALPITAPKRLPEFPQAKTPFPFEKPGGTLAPPKTKRPGRRRRPKTTPSPHVPKSKPALEPAVVPPEPLVPTIDSKPAKHLLSKPTAKPDTPPPTSAPKTSQKPRKRRPRPRPKHKTTPRPETPQTKLVEQRRSLGLDVTLEFAQWLLPKHHKDLVVHVPDLKPHEALKYLRQNWVNVQFVGLRLLKHHNRQFIPIPDQKPHQVLKHLSPNQLLKHQNGPVVRVPNLKLQQLLRHLKPNRLIKQHEFVVHVPDLKPHQALKHLRPNWLNGILMLMLMEQVVESITHVSEPPETTLAETDQSTQELYTTKIPRMTELAKTTQVLNKTTTRPSRPRPSGTPRGNGIGAAIIPGTRRPPLPPRPMPPRRKPLPPNNVTGKPGSAGIISSDRVTSPPLRATLRPTEAPLERMETDKKQPTAPASGEDLGPHVRYIQKPDNSPCSITDSVKRFPKEEATEGNATSPPQNPPTNLTVVTVEGCPSFVILDWDKPLNDTVTEYEVISRENGSFSGKNKSIQTTNQTFSTVENLKPDTSYEFQVKPKNPLGEGPPSNTVAFSTESAGRDAIWTERPFNSDSYSECKGKQYVKRTWYKKFVGVQLCNSLRYKIYLSDSLTGDQRGHGEDHCQFVDSFLDGRTGQQLSSDQLPTKEGYFRAVRQEPVQFGEIGGHTQINYVQWYECGTTIPGKW